MDTKGEGVKWISVDDRLPEVEEVVLAWEPAWYSVPFPMQINSRGQWVWWYDRKLAGKITHWQPLPKPPGESE